MTKPPRHLITPALLFAVVLLGGLFRFYKLDERGLDGSDNVFYTSIAKSWSEGERIYQVADHLYTYRPVVYWLYATGIKLFGFNDTSIKLVNASADTVNIGLIFVIGFLISRKEPWPAFGAALIYACSPIAIEFSRIELTHTLSATMVLLAMFFFVLHYTASGVWWRRLHIGLAGISTGAAVLTHEELAVTVPGYIFFYMVIFFSQEWRAEISSFIVDSLVFAGSLLIACGKAIPAHSYYVINCVASQGKTALADATLFQQVISYLEKFMRFFWDAVVAYGSAPTAIIFFPLLGLLAVNGALACLNKKQGQVSPLLFLPAIVLVSYIAGFAMLFKVFHMRLFIPMFPLLVLTLAIWVARLLAHLRFVPLPVRNGIVAGIACIIAVSNLGNYTNTRIYYVPSFSDSWASVSTALSSGPASGYQRLKSRSFSTSRARLVYDLLKGKVHETSRLLVIGSRFFPLPGRRPLQIDYYFGDNAIDLIDHTEPLDELISKYKIKYVLYTSSWGPRGWINRRTYTRYAYSGRWIVAEPLTLGASYGFDLGEFTVQKEWDYLMEYLEERGAELLLARDRRGGVSKNPPQNFDVGYFLFAL